MVTMKQTLLVVIASGAIGAATAVLLVHEPAAPARSPARAHTLDPFVLETAFRRALSSVGFGAHARAEVLPTPTAGGAEPARQADAPAEPMRRPGKNRALPPPKRDVLASVRPFHEDDRLRRSWLFRSERDVIEWLGTPDQVVNNQGRELWIYNVPGQGGISLEFHRGRLLNLYR